VTGTEVAQERVEIPTVTPGWVQTVLRATMQTESAWIKACPGKGECVHEDERWFWTLDHGEARCHGRGHARLSRLVLALHRLFGRLVISSDAEQEPLLARRATPRTRGSGETWHLLRQRNGKEEVVCEGSRGRCWVASRKLEVMSLSQQAWSVPVNGAQYRLQRLAELSKHDGGETHEVQRG